MTRADWWRSKPAFEQKAKQSLVNIQPRLGCDRPQNESLAHIVGLSWT